jgi:hypothetical protein
VGDDVAARLTGIYRALTSGYIVLASRRESALSKSVVALADHGFAHVSASNAPVVRLMDEVLTREVATRDGSEP